MIVLGGAHAVLEKSLSKGEFDQEYDLKVGQTPCEIPICI